MSVGDLKAAAPIGSKETALGDDSKTAYTSFQDVAEQIGESRLINAINSVLLWVRGEVNYIIIIYVYEYSRMGA
jgi:hypothetical protein